MATGALPPSGLGLALSLPLLLLAVAMTGTPLIWVVARRLRLPGTGEQPALALRAGAWLGLWAAACVGLQVARLLSWTIALTLAMVLVLLESFLLQKGKASR
jgi:hypothetical protein